mgnify:CR=1 FL=1
MIYNVSRYRRFLQLVACALTPSDAHPIVKGFADIVLQHPGGKGAVRELSEIIVEKNKESYG